MFDYHIHSVVSFDGHDTPEKIVASARAQGLREICFTDHVDHELAGAVFDLKDYARAYDDLTAPDIAIRRGMEFGLTPENRHLLREDLLRRRYDYVIGSVHTVGNEDVYLPPYWETKTVEQAYREYLEQTLACVRAHEDYDVLGHLTYICKCRGNPTKVLLRYEDHAKILDEILRELARRDKGLEMNTSGVDRCGGFLPTADFFLRFRELGGRIVTVGSDAHTADRVGQYTYRACQILEDIFGYVCTFADRKPIFHTK